MGLGVGMGFGSRVVGKERGWTWEVEGKGRSDGSGEGLLLRVGGGGDLSVGGRVGLGVGGGGGDLEEGGGGGRVLDGGGGGEDLYKGGGDGLGETAGSTCICEGLRILNIFFGGVCAMSGVRRGDWRVAGVGGVNLRFETTSEKRRGAGGGVPHMLKEEGRWEVEGLGVWGG